MDNLTDVVAVGGNFGGCDTDRGEQPMTEPMDCRHGHRIKFGERVVNVRGETGDLSSSLSGSISKMSTVSVMCTQSSGGVVRASMPCTMRA